MKPQKTLVQQSILKGLVAVALMLPPTVLAGVAQASMASRDVRGALPERAQRFEQPNPMIQLGQGQGHYQAPQTRHQELSLTERAINPVLNLHKPINYKR